MDVKYLQSFIYIDIVICCHHIDTHLTLALKGSWECAWDQLRGANWWGLGCISQPNLWLQG